MQSSLFAFKSSVDSVSNPLGDEGEATGDLGRVSPRGFSHSVPCREAGGSSASGAALLGAAPDRRTPNEQRSKSAGPFVER